MFTISLQFIEFDCFSSVYDLRNIFISIFMTNIYLVGKQILEIERKFFVLIYVYYVLVSSCNARHYVILQLLWVFYCIVRNT